MNEPIIRLTHLHKVRRFYKNNHERIQHEFFGRDSGKTFKSLDDLSLEIRKGERVALIGSRSGMSAILRIIAGIIAPDSGEVEVNGEVSTYLAHRVGFDEALTGKDNMAVAAALRGISKETLQEHMAEMLEFAKLSEEYLDKPLKRWPKGKATLMGFALATSVKPDIFLLGETFRFNPRRYNPVCRKRLQDLIEDEDCTLIMTTTNYLVTKRLCTRGIAIYQGKIVFDGDFVEAVQFYQDNYKNRAGKEADPDIVETDLEPYAESAIEPDTDTDIDPDADTDIDIDADTELDFDEELREDDLERESDEDDGRNDNNMV